MNKRIKKLWIKALRSGKFKQTQNWLRNSEGHCCLGVLCEVYAQQTGEGRWNDRVFTTKQTSSSGTLPKPVREWAEIDVSDPLLGRTLTASRLNDKGKSFTFIADRIEKYL